MADIDYELPKLYKIDSNGKERIWRIWVGGSTVYREAGLVKGKKVPSQRTYTGKNIGKKNETTDEEQAHLEADGMWTKQLDKGYTPKCKEGKAMYKRVKAASKEHGGHNINAKAQIRGGKQKTVKQKNTLRYDGDVPTVIPMKTYKWEVDKNQQPLPRVTKHFDFDEGVYTQWKLDGYRCIARIIDGNVVLTTNSSNQYPWFESLRTSIKKFMMTGDCLDGLDGEVYAHHLFDQDGNEILDVRRFAEIQGICAISRSSPHELEDQICLYVFDLLDTTGKYDQDARFARLKKLFKKNRDPRIVMTRTEVANSANEVNEIHNEYAAEGYEGIIIRSRELIYQQDGRPLKIRKYKYFVDDEFKIVGAQKDDGVDEKYFVWICKTKQGKKFRAPPGKGFRDAERRKMWKHHKKYIGKMMTVEYQDLDDETGIPRFPKAKGIREDFDVSDPKYESDSE